MVDMEMGAKYIVHLVVSDAERKQLVAPALLAGKIERRRMTLVLAGAGIHQDRVMRCADHESLIGDHHHSQRLVEHLRLHRRQVTLEDGLVIGREEVLRPPPRAFALNHGVDGDVPDPDLPHPVPSNSVVPNSKCSVHTSRRSDGARAAYFISTDMRARQLEDRRGDAEGMGSGYHV